MPALDDIPASSGDMSYEIPPEISGRSLCFNSAILTPVDVFKESVPASVIINPSTLMTQLKTSSNTLARIGNEESEHDPFFESSYPLAPPKNISLSIFNTHKISRIPLKKEADVLLCAREGGTLMPFTRESPGDINYFLNVTNTPNTIIRISHPFPELHENGIYSASGLLLATNSSSLKDETYALYKPKPSGKIPYELFDLDDVIDKMSCYAICIFASQRASGMPMMKAYATSTKRLLSSAAKVAKVASTFSNLISSVPIAPISYAGKITSSLLKTGSPFLESALKYSKLVKGKPELFDHDNLSTMQSLNRYSGSFLKNFKILGKKLLFRPSPDARWKQLDIKERDSRGFLRAELRGPTKNQKVIVYKITPLYLTTESPFLEITPEYFIQTPDLNFTTSSAPLKQGCEMGICRNVRYPNRNARCASSIPNLGVDCPQRAASTSRIIKVSCYREGEKNMILTAFNRSVLISCITGNTVVNAIPGTSMTMSGCDASFNNDSPRSAPSNAIFRHVNNLQNPGKSVNSPTVSAPSSQLKLELKKPEEAATPGTSEELLLYDDDEELHENEYVQALMAGALVGIIAIIGAVGAVIRRIMIAFGCKPCNPFQIFTCCIPKCCIPAKNFNTAIDAKFNHMISQNGEDKHGNLSGLGLDPGAPMLGGTEMDDLRMKNRENQQNFIEGTSSGRSSRRNTFHNDQLSNQF